MKEHDIDAELQKSREQLKSSIQLAWSQVSLVKTSTACFWLAAPALPECAHTADLVKGFSPASIVFSLRLRIDQIQQICTSPRSCMVSQVSWVKRCVPSAGGSREGHRSCQGWSVFPSPTVLQASLGKVPPKCRCLGSCWRCQSKSRGLARSPAVLR